MSHRSHVPKKVHSDDIVTAVKKILTKYYSETYYKDYENIFNLHQSLFGSEKYSAVMQSEKIILCEINACLWSKACHSAINCITKQAFPHYIIAEKFINYLLNAETNENFGIIEEYFWKLLLTHPPKPEMFNYYWKILSDYFVTLRNEKPEDETVLFCLLEGISNILKNKKKIFQEENKESDCTNENLGTISAVSSDVKNLETTQTHKPVSNKYSDLNGNKKVIYFSELPWTEQLNRCLIVLNFVHDILKTDFICWLHSKKLKPIFADSKPLLSCLLWSNIRDIGLINKEVHKILDVYDLVLQSSDLGIRNLIVIEKLVTLVGEVIKCCDYIDGVKYPFAGKKCDNFFRELAVILQQRVIKTKDILTTDELLVKFRPPWLRLFVCSRLLASVTEYQCPSDLTGVYDILEYIAYWNKRKPSVNNESFSKIIQKPSKSTNSRLIRKFKTSGISVNAKLRTGKTHLHTACEENDIEKIKALLTLPDLDVNAVDRDGWTPLHTAAYKGHAASVHELLSFDPESRGTKTYVNTRARGPESVTPLMSGAIGGNPKVCQLLLEHSGSVLLEDVNELNLTTLELTNAPEVLAVLQYYKNNKVWTLHSQKNINLDPNLKGVVLKLCVEMIQAYFSTYRTWDVYKKLKLSDHFKEENPTDCDMDHKWDYMCYHRDIKRNINKLKSLIPVLELVPEFKGLHDIYVRMLTLHKNR